eukprot:s2761_g20.t1
MSVAIGISEGLGPSEPLGAMAPQCDASVSGSNYGAFWIVAGVAFFICLAVVFAACWRRFLRWKCNLESRLSNAQSELQSAQEQLADQYDYAARLSERVDGLDGRINDLDEATEVLGARQAEGVGAV